MHAIPECHRGVFTTRCYTNARLPLPILTRVGKFLPLDGKTVFFHGKTVPAKIVFAAAKKQFLPLVGKKSQSKVFLQLQNKSEILF